MQMTSNSEKKVKKIIQNLEKELKKWELEEEKWWEILTGAMSIRDSDEALHATIEIIEAQAHQQCLKETIFMICNTRGEK